MIASLKQKISKSLLLTCLGASVWLRADADEPLAGTAPLTMDGDIASNLVAGVDRFLLRKIDESVAGRAQYWHRDFSSAHAYEQSITTNRLRMAYILGISDPRVSPVELEVIAAPGQSAACGRGQDYEVFAVRWPAFGDVTG